MHLLLHTFATITKHFLSTYILNQIGHFGLDTLCILNLDYLFKSYILSFRFRFYLKKIFFSMLQVLSKVYHRNWTNESSSFGDEIRYRERNTKYTEKKLIGGNDLAEDPWASASGSRANYLDKYCEWETKEQLPI